MRGKRGELRGVIILGVKEHDGIFEPNNLTVAGLLMFGKFESIRDESCVPRFFPDYKEIPVNTMEQRWIDRIYPDGSWEANLFQFYRRVLPKLQEVIPTPFKLENSQRIDETLAHESIREALANLCIHADYSEESSLLSRDNAGYSNAILQRRRKRMPEHPSPDHVHDVRIRRTRWNCLCLWNL